MKKVVVMIIVVTVMIFAIGANASDWSDRQKAIEDLEDYISENNLTMFYNGSIDEFGVYGANGIIDADYMSEMYSIDEDWATPETWFVEWYTQKLEEVYPEFGKVTVVMRKIGKQNETNIYHMTVIGENDLVDNIEGDQHIVDMLMVLV